MAATRRGENPHPPRYRLLSAIAANPARPALAPSASFERVCPACGRDVLFTQVDLEYVIEEHDCG